MVIHLTSDRNVLYEGQYCTVIHNWREAKLIFFIIHWTQLKMTEQSIKMNWKQRENVKVLFCWACRDWRFVVQWPETEPGIERRWQRGVLIEIRMQGKESLFVCARERYGNREITDASAKHMYQIQSLFSVTCNKNSSSSCTILLGCKLTLVCLRAVAVSCCKSTYSITLYMKTV